MALVRVFHGFPEPDPAQLSPNQLRTSKHTPQRSLLSEELLAAAASVCDLLASEADEGEDSQQSSCDEFSEAEASADEGAQLAGRAQQPQRLKRQRSAPLEIPCTSVQACRRAREAETRREVQRHRELLQQQAQQQAQQHAAAAAVLA